MRKTALALVAVAVLGLGTAATPAAAEPAPQACIGQLVSFGVQPENFGPGRRNVAETFVGDYPRAVQDVQGLAEGFCNS